MARGATGDLVNLAIVGGVLYVAYQMALRGQLGAAAQQAALSITGAPIGSALASGTRPGAVTAPCDTRFIPGVRYVAQAADGLYIVVIGGQIVFSTNVRETAEREYNRLVCSGAAVGGTRLGWET